MAEWCRRHVRGADQVRELEPTMVVGVWSLVRERVSSLAVVVVSSLGKQYHESFCLVSFPGGGLSVARRRRFYRQTEPEEGVLGHGETEPLMEGCGGLWVCLVFGSL